MDTQDDIIDGTPSVSDNSVKLLVEKELATFNKVATQLATVANKINRIPEPFFYMVLLPIIRDHFTGKRTEDIRKWLNIAGGMTKQILVYDDLTDEDLFYVPPFNTPIEPVLMNRAAGKRTISPNDLVELQEIHRKNGEQRKYMEIEETLGSIYLDTANHPIHAGHLMNLTLIWQRYDLPLEELYGDKVSDVLTTLAGQEVVVLEETVETTDTTPSTDPLDYDF